MTTPLGTAFEQTEAITADIERQVMAITTDELEAVTARIGHQNVAALDKLLGDADNEALVIVQFKRFGRRYSNAEWIERLPAALRVPEGVRLIYASQYFGPPTDQPVTIHVLSNDDAVRRSAAVEIENYLRNTPGVVEIDIDERPGTPQLELNLNYESLARLGLTAQAVGTTLAAAFHGIEASEHRDLDDTTELRVQFDPAARLNLDALLETPVRTQAGTLAPPARCGRAGGGADGQPHPSSGRLPFRHRTRQLHPGQWFDGDEFRQPDRTGALPALQGHARPCTSSTAARRRTPRKPPAASP